MFDTESFLAIWKKESDVCINLSKKIPAGGLDYRPSATQRTTLELMRYLIIGPYNGVHRTLAGDWAAALPAADIMARMNASDFADSMAWQADAVAREVRAASPSDLLHGEIKYPWNETMKKGAGLTMYPMRWLIGYRMQLFLYLKAAGNTAIGTAECWRVPAPAPAA